MEPGYGQDLVWSFNELQPLGSWESFSHGPPGGLTATGTFVSTDQSPDCILPGNLHHPNYHHEPYGVVHSPFQNFSPIVPVEDQYSSITLPWVAVGAMHHGMMPGELHNSLAGIGASESQVVQQCREEPTHSHNHVTKGEHMKLTSAKEPGLSGGSPLNVQSGTTQHLQEQPQVKGGLTWRAPRPWRMLTTQDSKSKRPCNCTKSQCLKRYCDCFANGDVCNNCNCVNCLNDVEHPIERHHAVLNCLDRNPEAFESAEVKGQHNNGCNCTQSSCVKNYCQCYKMHLYKANILCSSSCRCVGCLNVIDNSEMTTRVLGSPEGHINENKYKEQCGQWLNTGAVVEDICVRMLAQAAHAEQRGLCPELAQRKILQEFGHCLTKRLKSL